MMDQFDKVVNYRPLQEKPMARREHGILGLPVAALSPVDAQLSKGALQGASFSTKTG
jgi:hypothetical protein